MKRNFIFLFLLISSSLFAQKFTLEGIVKDSIPLEGSTVFIQGIKDSIVLSYGITNRDGKFSIRVNAENDSKVLFNVAYLGYKSYSKTISVPEGDVLDMGTIKLNEDLETLGEVSIIARAPPIVIKKDTIEYNADSFKTLPNDRAEDLLKKLPGVEIDTDGAITVNGIDVEAVNVDGMQFFGEKNGDIALKNLPSNVISKVQVTDYKTDRQKFTGEESDSGTKEINLKIKKGKNRAFFGDINVGAGTDEKYQANANLFQLIDGKQIGLISGTNNINMRRGFNALPDARSSTGAIESDFIGTNYSKGKWNETRVNGNYRFGANDVDNASKRTRENFLPDLNYITETDSKSNSDTDNHAGSVDLKFVIPSKNKLSKAKLLLSNELEFDRSDSDAFSQTNTLSKSIDENLISDYNATNFSTSTDNEIKNSFGVTSSTGNGVDYFNINLNTTFNTSSEDEDSFSENIIYEDNITVTQDQIRNTENKSSNINLNAIWVKELFSNFRIMPKYNASINHNNNEKFVYDFDEIDDGYTSFNDLQSFDSKYVTTSVKPSLRLRYEYKNLRFEAESGYTNTYRKFTDQLIDERNFDAGFEYLTYSGRIRYRDQNGYKNINLRYNQNVHLPSSTQLQPVADVSNITHVRIGNPFLAPEVEHDLSFQYQNNLAFNNINITGRLNAEVLDDKIINSTITNEDLTRNTTYTNIDGDYSLSGNAAISKSYYNKKTNFNINLRLNASYNNNISLQNAVKFTTKTTTLRPQVSFRYSYDSKIDLSTTYSYSTTESVYDTDVFQDNNFFVQNLNFDASIFFLKNAFFSNKVAYSYNSRVGDDFDGDAVFWNAGLGVQMWNNKATLTIIGYDILNMNNGFRRTVTETYIQDIENKILEQYFMLTFVYKFGTIAGQKMNAYDRGSRSRGSGQGGRSRGGGR